MLDGERFGEAEHDAAGDLGTGGFMFAASKDDVVVVEPNIEVFGAALTATAGEEVQSHDLIEGRLLGVDVVGWIGRTS